MFLFISFSFCVLIFVLNVHLLEYLLDEVKNRRLQAILLHRT